MVAPRTVRSVHRVWMLCVSGCHRRAGRVASEESPFATYLARAGKLGLSPLVGTAYPAMSSGFVKSPRFLAACEVAAHARRKALPVRGWPDGPPLMRTAGEPSGASALWGRGMRSLSRFSQRGRMTVFANEALYHVRAADAKILGSRYVARWEPNRRPVRRSLGLRMRVQPRSAGSSGAWITQPEDRGTHLKMTGSQMRIATALRWRAIFLGSRQRPAVSFESRPIPLADRR